MSYSTIAPALASRALFRPRRALGQPYLGDLVTEQRSAAGHTYRAVKPEHVAAVRKHLTAMSVRGAGVSEQHGIPIEFIKAQAPAIADQFNADGWVTERYDDGDGIIIEDVTVAKATVGAVAPERIGALSAVLKENPDAAVLLDPPGGWQAPAPLPAPKPGGEILPSEGSVPLKYVVVGAVGLLALGAAVALLSG